MIADKETGRILGGQAIGEGPSDKFIDILAMALHGKMTCRELASVDLAYAPPFSPVLSPIIVAANVLMNKLEGKVEGIQASEVKEKLETSKETFQVSGCQGRGRGEGEDEFRVPSGFLTGSLKNGSVNSIRGKKLQSTVNQVSVLIKPALNFNMKVSRM